VIERLFITTTLPVIASPSLLRQSSNTTHHPSIPTPQTARQAS
jgi:hypothetical protein